VLASLFGYFLCMIAMLSAVVAVLTGFFNISTGNGRHYPHAAIARTVTVELQRHPQVVKEAAPAKDVPLVVSAAKAGNKSKHNKAKVFAHRPNNGGYGYALGYGEEPGGPKGFFFR
jgi:ureidoglycolate hydrolase